MSNLSISQLTKPVLAIETSGEACSVAIVWSEERFVETTSKIKFSHSKKIFSIIETALSIAEISLTDISAIAVSIGPGSFTGLRIGLAAAKGIALGASLPIIPIPTFEAIALEALTYTQKGEIFFIANKVNREEIYFAGFNNKGNIYKFERDLTIVSKNDLAANFENEKIFGNSGNGLLVSPSAKWVGLWSILFGKGCELAEFDFLEPLYIKDFLVKGTMIK